MFKIIAIIAFIITFIGLIIYRLHNIKIKGKLPEIKNDNSYNGEFIGIGFIYGL